MSEAPSLPLYDDKSGPIAAPPMVGVPSPIATPSPIAARPPIATRPSIATPVFGMPRSITTRTPPTATPSIIVAEDAVVVAPPEPPPPEPPPPAPSPPEQAPYVPEPISASDDMTNPIAVESRTPGSSFILPANPLMNITDQSLGGFVDCALYEETGNFFRAPGYEESLVDIDDVVVPPPAALSPVQAIRQQGATPTSPGLSPGAFSPPPEPEQQQQFAPDATPLPMLAPQRDSPPRPYSEPLIPADAVPFTPAPEAARPAPIDSTGDLVAMSSPGRRRWLMFGGAAAATSLLVLAIVIAKGGSGDPKPAPVKVASMQPRTPESNEPPEPATPSAVASDVTAPTVAVTPPDAKVAAARVPIEVPEESNDSNGPPVVGTGPCRLTVSSTPAGSIVRIDDQSIGPSPITFNGPCKRSKVDVKHPRYALGTKFVVLTADTPTEIQVPLVRPTHAITIVTVPPGATISIGGNRAGTSPTSVKVMGFSGLKLTVEKRGFKPMEQKVYSKVDGERITLKLSKW